MTPKDYSQMMAYLTRPAMARGGRIGFKNGTKNRPKIAGVDFKKVISDSFEKISNQKGKVSISDIVSDTGYSKPTIYKYLSESQSAKLIGQPSPFRDKITKQVNQIIEDVFKNKKPLINASPNKIFEKIYGKKFNIKTDNTGVIKKILEENPNWPKIKNAVTNTSTRVGAGNKIFETIKLKDFDKAYETAMKSRSLTRAGTVEEFILRDLKRHIDQGGTKFEFAKGNSLEKGFKGLKIKDLTKGDVIDFASIKKDDPRFKEYKKVFNDIKKLKLTPYTNPVTKEKITLLKGLQEATGVDAPLHIQHNKGVGVEPLKNLSIATHKANQGARMVESLGDIETLGVRSTLPGGKRVYGPKLSFEDEINRLTKFSDRMIKGAGTRTLKTPTKTLTKTKQIMGQAKQFKNIVATLGGGNCGRIRKYQGGRIGLQDGTPNVDVCFKNATNRINSGFKNATPAEARNYTKLLNAVKGSAVIGKNLLKFGIVPEALFVGADTLVRVGYGDTFKEAGLRAADFFIPGDLTQEADKLKVQRTLGGAASTNVGRVFDYRNQIAKIDNLQSQKQNLENLSNVGEFDYIGDLSQDVKNINMSLNQAKNDLQNKFMVSEAETVAADRALEEAYDASMAKGRFAKILKTLRDIEPVQDDPFLSDITSPQKTQMDLNLKMFSPMQTDFMKMTDTDIINRRRQLIDEGYDLPSSKQLMADRDKEIADMKARSLLSFPREQVFGTQGTFFGQPLAGGGIAKMAGVDQGPPPESGPNSQGLQGLMKRVKNL